MGTLIGLIWFVGSVCKLGDKCQKWEVLLLALGPGILWCFTNWVFVDFCPSQAFNIWRFTPVFELIKRLTKSPCINGAPNMLVHLAASYFAYVYISVYIHIYTHTCWETSYRITDVECIVRAKNTPVNLTGDGEWPGVRNSVEEFCRWNCNNVVDSVFNS